MGSYISETYLVSDIFSSFIDFHSITLLGPINGGWSDWTWPKEKCLAQSELNGCEEIVPVETQTGRRVCDSPEPQYGGLPCAGEETVTRDCYQCNDQGKILPSVKYQNQIH